MPGRRHADHAPGPVLEGHGAAVQRVDLLRLDPRDRRRLVLRVARGDRDLRALGALALAHELGDVLGERLGAERRLAEHHLSDRLVDDLLEARHVRALLVVAEIHEALEPREEQLVADAHDLLDAGDADAREPDGDRRRARLDIVARRARGRRDGRCAASAAPRASLARAFARAAAAGRRLVRRPGSGIIPAQLVAGRKCGPRRPHERTELAMAIIATHGWLSVGRGGRCEERSGGSRRYDGGPG